MGLKDTNKVTTIAQLIEHTSITGEYRCTVEISAKYEQIHIDWEDFNDKNINKYGSGGA